MTCSGVVPLAVMWTTCHCKPCTAMTSLNVSGLWIRSYMTFLTAVGLQQRALPDMSSLSLEQ